MGLVATKPVFRVSDKARLKHVSSATKTSQKTKISIVASLDIVLSITRTKKALIRLHGCAGWSAPVLFANPRRKVFSRRGPNQIPHLTHYTIWESDKNITKRANRLALLSKWPQGCMAARNRQDSMTRSTNNKIQKIYKRGTSLELSVRKLLKDLNMFDGTNLSATAS